MANNTEATKNEAGNGEQKKLLEPLPQAATKQYTRTGADGTKINYTATAEMIPVRADDGQLIGHMFMFSHFRSGRQVGSSGDVLLERRPRWCLVHGQHRWHGRQARQDRWHGAPEGRR